MKKLSFFLVCSLLVLVSGCVKPDSFKPQVDETPSILIDGVVNGEISLPIGDYFEIKPSLSHDTKTPLVFGYRMYDENIISIDDKGEIEALAIGETTVRVVARNNPLVVTSFNVKTVPSNVKLEKITVVGEDAIVMDLDEVYDITKKFALVPRNVPNKKVKYKLSNTDVISIDANGKIKSLDEGETVVTISADSDETILLEITVKVIAKETREGLHRRSNWTITTSHASPSDGKVNGAPESVIDGDNTTCILIVKPGKNYGGTNVKADDEVYFVLDMKKRVEFSYFTMMHRLDNKSDFFHVQGVSLYGSNDGKTFDVVKENIDITYDKTTSEAEVDLAQVYKYRYLKVRPIKWSTKDGSCMQIAEFNLGYKKIVNK